MAAASPTSGRSSPGSGGEESRAPTPATAAAVAAAAPPPSSVSAAPGLTMEAKGAGITVRLEDDSGTHFVPPRRRRRRPLHREDDDPAPLSPFSLPSSGGSSGSGHGANGREEMEAEQLFPTPLSRGLSMQGTTAAAAAAAGGGLRDSRELQSEGLEFAESHGEYPAGVAASGGGTVPAVDGEDVEGLKLSGPSGGGKLCTGSRLGAIRGSPPQPVVEVSVGEWSASFSRVCGGGGGGDIDDDACERGAVPVSAADGGGDTASETPLASATPLAAASPAAAATTTTAIVSISTVRVVDLLQQVPCHRAFCQLLVIPSELAPAPTSPSPKKSPPPSSATGPASPSWREWLEEEEDHDQRLAGGQAPLDNGVDDAGPVPPPPPPPPGARLSGDAAAGAGPPRRSPSPPSPPPPPPHQDVSGSGGPQAIRVTYRQVASFGDGVSVSPAERAEERGKSAAVGPTQGFYGDSSGEGGGEGEQGEGRGGETGKRGGPTTTAADAAAAPPSATSTGERRRSTLAIGLEHPVTANWNPRTLVALWGVRSALAHAAAAATGEGDTGADTAAEESDYGGSEERARRRRRPAQASAGVARSVGARATPAPSCSTEIRVAARRGLEVRRFFFAGVVWLYGSRFFLVLLQCRRPMMSPVPCCRVGTRGEGVVAG